MATAPVTLMAVMPATMGDLLDFNLFIALEDSRIRLVQLIQNSVALGNAGNSAAGADYSSKRCRPRNA